MEKINIQFLKPHPEYAYFAGDNAELSADNVAKLISTGHVILFPGEKSKEVNPLPEGLPCREILFENGFDTIEKVTEAGESITEIKGIGKKSLAQITEFIASHNS